MPILDDWLKDLPQQYLGQANIEVLISAFARQLQEVEQALEDVNTLTDLETATGKNLDYVGSILSLTRKEAGVLSGSDEPVMSDERYRQYLKFQLLKNTNECTYYDLMNGAKLLWNVSPVLYVEDETYPATIILQVPLTKEDGTPTVIGEVPIVKPAGVSVLYQYKCGGTIEVSEYMEKLLYKPPPCNELICGTHPITATLGHSSKNSVELTADAKSCAYTPRFCGTYPVQATLFASVQAEIEISTCVKGYAVVPRFCGTWPAKATLFLQAAASVEVKDSSGHAVYESKFTAELPCGTAPSTATAGISAESGDVTLEQNTVGTVFAPTFCNTKYCGQEV